MQAVELDAARRYSGLAGYEFCAALPARDVEEHMAVQRDGAALIAVLPAGIVGFLLLLPVDRGTHILEAAVAMEHQRYGIGRSLFERAEQWAGSHSREITLTTYRDVPWNAPLYGRMGYQAFTVDGTRPQLQALIAEEAASGFARQARVAMRKSLL